MTRTETVISVFVASPADVSEERAILEEVIRQLNVSWRKTFSVSLELLAWETHASPDFGADPQDVIDGQIGDDYDIFVGIMWARFGTPTSHAGSGTQQEFERAYTRYSADTTSVRLMMYFKDEAIRPSEVDPEQLAKVEGFKDSIRERKGLYWTFTDAGKFKDMVTLHLNRVIQDWHASAGFVEASAALAEQNDSVDIPRAVAEAEGEDEELGLLDHVGTVNETSGRLIEAVERMTASLKTLTERTQERTNEFEEAGVLPSEQQLKAFKRATKRSAADMDEFVDRAEIDIPIVSESLSAGIEAFGRIASLSGDFGDGETEMLKQCLGNIVPIGEAVAASLEPTRNLRASIAGLPRLTAVFNKSKKRIVTMLSKIIVEYEAAVELASEVEEVVRRLLGESDSEDVESGADDI